MTNRYFNKKSLVLFIGLVLLNAQISSAQMDLDQGLQDAADELESVIVPLRAFLYIIAAIVGIFGGIKVYTKFQNQDQDTTKAAGTYGFAFIFLMAAGYLIDAIFL